MNRNNTLLSLSLIFSVVAPAMAMDSGFGPESFGKLAHAPSDEEKAKTYLYIPYGDHADQSDEEKVDNIGVQTVDAIIEEQSEVMSSLVSSKKKEQSVAEYEAQLVEFKSALKPVLKSNEQLNPAEPQYSPETKELLAVQQETQDQMMQNELGASHNSSPELPQVVPMREVEPLMGQNLVERVPEATPLREDEQVQAEVAQEPVLAPASTTRFFGPAMRIAQQAPDYYAAKYLAKDGTYDLSKANILAHKRDLTYTVTLYAATVAALSGIVWGVVKFFKKAPKATNDEPAVKEVSAEPKKQQFKRPNPETVVNLN